MSASDEMPSCDGSRDASTDVLDATPKCSLNPGAIHDCCNYLTSGRARWWVRRGTQCAVRKPKWARKTASVRTSLLYEPQDGRFAASSPGKFPSPPPPS